MPARGEPNTLGGLDLQQPHERRLVLLLERNLVPRLGPVCGPGRRTAPPTRGTPFVVKDAPGQNPLRFLVARCHEQPEVELVVERHEGFLIVEKHTA